MSVNVGSNLYPAEAEFFTIVNLPHHRKYFEYLQYIKQCMLVLKENRFQFARILFKIIFESISTHLKKSSGLIYYAPHHDRSKLRVRMMNLAGILAVLVRYVVLLVIFFRWRVAKNIRTGVQDQKHLM